MQSSKLGQYFVIEKDVLPDIFEKIIIAKRLLMTGECTEITEVTRRVGISRSSFYKYKDKVFQFSEKNVSKKVIMNFMLNHKHGILADVIKIISEYGANILTLNQEIPINGIASVNITFELNTLNEKTGELVESLKNIKGVRQASIVAME